MLFLSRLRHACLFFLLLLLAAAQAVAETASQRAEHAFVRHAPVPSWVLPAAPLSPAPDAPLGVRLNDVQFYVADQPATYVHRAVTARDIGSLEGVANLELSVQPDYEILQVHKLLVHRGGHIEDRLDAVDVRFLQRERGLEQGVYSGRVTVAIVVPDLRVGDTLEVEYTTTGANPVFEGKFMNAAQWDSSYPTAYRRIVLSAPRQRPVGYRLIGTSAGPVPIVSESVRDGRRFQVFEGRDLPATLIDSGVPRDVQVARWLQFSEYASWRDVDAWAVRLFQAEAPAASFAAELAPARAARTPEEALVRALEFVQNEIRYLSLALGENSHRPASPAEVLKRRYGDCKDKSLLLVTMLRALGIEADPVLVPVSLHKGLDQYLPSPILFDHAIVRASIGGKRYFVDPTRQGQHGMPARLGQPLAGANVLVVRAGELQPVTIPFPDEPELQRRVEQVSVTAMDQPPRLTVRSEYSGTAAEMLRSGFARSSQAELRKAAENMIAKRYPEAQLVGDVTMRDDREHNTVVIESAFTVPHMFSETGAGWKIDYSATNMASLFLPPASAKRVAPLAIPGYPSEVSYEMDIRLPDSFAMREDSATKTIDDPAFEGSRTLSLAKNGLRLQMNLRLRADRVEAARTAEFDRKLQAWNDLGSGALQVFKSNMRAAVPELASEEQRLRLALGKLDQAVQDAERSGREQGRALCERGKVRAYLGQTADAVKDAIKAVKVQEQATDLLACRGEIYLLAGRAREAEADLTRSIARGYAETAVFFQRGLANLYLNRRAESLADFKQAARAADEGERLGAATMQASLGALPPGPGPVEDSENAWLPVAIDMFGGKAAPEHLVSMATQGPRATTDARLTAAYYFAGRYLSQKNPLKARAYFERARDKRALASIYYHAARMELDRAQP
jgi:transglutaminase-like putative cysteine protease